MGAFERILVGIDFTPASRDALRRAGLLGRRLSAHVTALHAHPFDLVFNDWAGLTQPPRLTPAARGDLERDLRSWVAAAADDADVVVREGDAGTELLAFAAESSTDLIVLGRRDGRRFARWLAGSMTERVVRYAGCPVLVVPPREAAGGFERILCAVDLTPSSSATLEAAAEMARALGAHLVLLHVVEDVPREAREPGRHEDEDRSARRALTAAQRDLLASLVAREARDGLTLELRIVFGDARDEIVRASEGVDMVVLGLQSTDAVDRLLFGSTAQHVLRAAAAPALFVRHSHLAARRAASAYEHALLTW